MVHLYEEVGRLHVWEWHLEVLDDLNVTGLIYTDGFDFRGIGHGVAEIGTPSYTIRGGLETPFGRDRAGRLRPS